MKRVVCRSAAFVTAACCILMGSALTAGEPVRAASQPLPLAAGELSAWTEPIKDLADQAEVKSEAKAKSERIARSERGHSSSRKPRTVTVLPPRVDTTATTRWTTPASLSGELATDRIWLVSTRRITSQACRANLQSPNLSIWRLDRCGRRTRSSLEEYTASMTPDRPRLIYVHGNQRSAEVALQRGLELRRELSQACRDWRPFDWVIWSWQSDREALLVRDARLKATRTEAQGLYLAWLLTHHATADQPTGLIGFSFGGRIVTGALHALAGGTLSGRCLPTPPVVDAGFDVGLLAPAVETRWISTGGYHERAAKNMDQMVLLYNHRDIALKAYWLVAGRRGAKALGYTGPRCVAPRADGTPLPIRAKDCAQAVGPHHRETRYYHAPCGAGREMASLIQSTLVRQTLPNR